MPRRSSTDNSLFDPDPNPLDSDPDPLDSDPVVVIQSGTPNTVVAVDVDAVAAAFAAIQSHNTNGGVDVDAVVAALACVRCLRAAAVADIRSSDDAIARLEGDIAEHQRTIAELCAKRANDDSKRSAFEQAMVALTGRLCRAFRQ